MRPGVLLLGTRYSLNGNALTNPLGGVTLTSVVTPLPLSVGILTVLMWVPFSGLIRHWVGIFHGVARPVLVVTAWYVFPHARFVAIPGVIAALYLLSIAVLASAGRQSRTIAACVAAQRIIRQAQLARGA